MSPGLTSAASRAQVRARAADLPAVWHADTTTDADRKQLLRHLIEGVTVTVTGDSEQVDVEVSWAGGNRTTGRVTRPVATLAQLSYFPRLRERAGELSAAGCTAAQIAESLNSEGLRPPERAETFTKNSVHDLLSALGLQHARAQARRPELGEHEWWLRDLAARPGRRPAYSGIGLPSMTGSSPWWSSQAARRASCWCSRGQAVAAAVPYRDVSVTVVTAGSGQVAGSPRTSLAPCRGGRPFAPGARGRAGEDHTPAAPRRPGAAPRR